MCTLLKAKKCSCFRPFPSCFSRMPWFYFGSGVETSSMAGIFGFLNLVQFSCFSGGILRKTFLFFRLACSNGRHVVFTIHGLGTTVWYKCCGVASLLCLFGHRSAMDLLVTYVRGGLSFRKFQISHRTGDPITLIHFWFRLVLNNRFLISAFVYKIGAEFGNFSAIARAGRLKSVN